jgi:hypothetical protein
MSRFIYSQRRLLFMAGFDITVDGACAGKTEDVANMKRRLKAILENRDKLDDPQWFRDLFGDELGEIESWGDPLDVDDEGSRYSVFGGLFYEWDDVDVDGLRFSGYSPHSSDQAGYVENFLTALVTVFPRVQFHFIAWCYISWGGYVIYEGGGELYLWDESDGGAEKKDAYVDWKLAERTLRFLPKDAPADVRDAAEKAVKTAEAAFEEKIAESEEED